MNEAGNNDLHFKTVADKEEVVLEESKQDEELQGVGEPEPMLPTKCACGHTHAKHSGAGSCSKCDCVRFRTNMVVQPDVGTRCYCGHTGCQHETAGACMKCKCVKYTWLRDLRETEDPLG